MKLHQALEQIKTQYEASHKAQLAELAGAQALLEELGILPVLDHVTASAQLHISEDHFYQGPHSPGRPAGRYWATNSSCTFLSLPR